MKQFVRIKVMSLAAEAKLIREAERFEKWKARAAAGRAKAARLADGLGAEGISVTSLAAAGLRHHRVNDVRKEARTANLVYGFLRGRSYREMERFSWSQPNWARIEKLVMRYSEEDPRIVAQRFSEWLSEAQCGVRPKFMETLQPGSVRGSMHFDGDWVRMQAERNFALG